MSVLVARREGADHQCRLAMQVSRSYVANFGHDRTNPGRSADTAESTEMTFSDSSGRP